MRTLCARTLGGQSAHRNDRCTNHPSLCALSTAAVDSVATSMLRPLVLATVGRSLARPLTTAEAAIYVEQCSTPHCYHEVQLHLEAFNEETQ